MSNRPKIDLTRLAEQLTGAKVDRRPAAPSRSAPPAFPRVTPERVNELLDLDLIKHCKAEFHASGHRERGGGVRWVMDMSYYKRLRAASGDKTDEELWTPNDADVFFGIPVQVRAGGGKPHLEPDDATAAALIRVRAMLDARGLTTLHFQGRPQ